MTMWDDEAGYDLADPKHPTWGDRMAEHADLTRKAVRESADPWVNPAEDDETHQ